MLESARRYGEAVEEGDWETALTLLHPEVEITRPSGRSYRGARDWVDRLARARGFRNLDTSCEGRSYEQRNGQVIEVLDIVHRWQHDGSLAYTSRETTTMTFRDGLIAALESSVVHHEPDEVTES
jgi:hypothetical protein